MKIVLLSLFAVAGISLAARAQAQELERALDIEEVVVTAQGREERMLGVPITMSSINREFLEITNTVTLPELSNFVPGLNIRVQTPIRPTFVIRGLTSDEVSPTAQPRVSTYFNNAPISRASMAKSNLFDMERVEVVKGPQGTLFGRGSQIGGINFITRRPISEFGGYVGAGIGNYGMKEIEGVINVPVIDNKLMIRTGGSYTYRDGYVTNLSGGKDLGDINSTDLRFSLRYLPMTNFRLDLVIDYQDDRDNGTPFMSKRFPNTKGVKDIFSMEASLDPGKEFFNKRKLLGTMLDMNYYFSNNSYLTSLTSFHDNKGDSHWDGDGTAAPAIDMTEYIKANQFSQELRYNFSRNRFNGFTGASYWREDVRQEYGFNPNEQYLVWLLMDMFQPGMGDAMILPNGQPNQMYDEMFSGILAGMGMPSMPMPPLGERKEMKTTSAVNSAYDIFADMSYDLTDRLVLTAGLRGTWERLTVVDRVDPVEGSAPSTLGMLTQIMTTGTYDPQNPNFLFAPTFGEDKKTYFSTVWRANLKYLIGEHATLFGGYSKGRRPNVLQPDAEGNIEEMNAERVDNFEVGFKYLKKGRLWFDVGLFYFLYNNFQAATFDNMVYRIIDAGKAKSYGAELTLNATVCRWLDVFGNYAYIHARFDDNPANSVFAGNRFRLTPDHSFALGLNAKARLTRNIGMIFTPTYSYKSKIWFEDDNNPELTQDAYGLLNLNLAFRFRKPALNVSFFCNNVTDERYIISAGNTGSMFGVPTFVPGLPTTLGMRLKWNF
ncbi:MAG: TonB-dependent receptor [Rikenellaceae bacterium]|nr:TonB-dependent receptor [Rikenellaceae bacterium]MCL2691944.1 TonB-dependent receptor [Rikenellaceae bacterium]